MSYPTSDHLLLNVRCPHCAAALVVSVSGFAGELTTRAKTCSKCSRDFHVHLLASTSTVKDTISDAQIAEYNYRLKYLNGQRREKTKELREKLELAKKEETATKTRVVDLAETIN